MIKGLKRFHLPRGIYARGILILIFPVVTLQLVVSVMFIQRHFDRVTRQLVLNMEPHIGLVLSRINSSEDIQVALARVAPIADPFNLQVSLSPSHDQTAKDRRAIYDFTGKIVTEMIHEGNPSVTSVDLLANQGKSVEIRADTMLGEAKIVIMRSVVSPSNPHQLLVLMIVTGILMTLIAFGFLRNQLRPIHRLARASEAFGKGQSLDYKIAGSTEVRSAGRAFLDMRERIEKQIEQRTQMLSDISHDLKTPLTRLRIGLEMLNKNPEIDALISDVDTMSVMIQEFLAFSRDAATEEFRTLEPTEFVEKIVAQAATAGAKYSV